MIEALTSEYRHQFVWYSRDKVYILDQAAPSKILERKIGAPLAVDDSLLEFGRVKPGGLDRLPKSTPSHTNRARMKLTE